MVGDLPLGEVVDLFFLFLICLVLACPKTAMMISLGLQECLMLEGTSNFLPWKCTLQRLMEEFESLSLRTLGFEHGIGFIRIFGHLHSSQCSSQYPRHLHVSQGSS
jgi:hypothetical protein